MNVQIIKTNKNNTKQPTIIFPSDPRRDPHVPLPAVPTNSWDFVRGDSRRIRKQTLLLGPVAFSTKVMSCAQKGGWGGVVRSDPLEGQKGAFLNTSYFAPCAH